MNKRVFYLVMMSCFLLAGPVSAQKAPGFLKKHVRTHNKASLRHSRQISSVFDLPALPVASVSSRTAQEVARPTTVYREDNSGQKWKYECTYDTYGHVASVKLYEWNSEQETYTLRGSVEREYHRLPNGEFVITKAESEYLWNAEHPDKHRHTAAYDSKGMHLWSQGEAYNFEASEWNPVSRTEARIENGVRTAILHDGVVDDRYTFDNKGRLTRYRNNGYTYSEDMTYTWNNNDRLVEVVDSGVEDLNGDGIFDDTYTVTYSNLQIVHNEKYFDPYSLEPFPFGSSSNSDSSEQVSWGNFSIDDYTLHTVYYTMDMNVVENGMEMQAQRRATVNAAKNQIKEEIIVGSIVFRTETTDLPDGYGSYRIISENGGEIDYEESSTYSEYGELLRDYVAEFSVGEGGEKELYFGHEVVYDREYDAQHRPVRTTVSNSMLGENPNASVTYVETYDAWTTVGLPSGIAAPARPAVSLYPNPATDYIVAGNAEQADITISDLSGRVVCRQAAAPNRATVSVAHLPAGVYFVEIRGNGGIAAGKFIKK
ncbi:MAG: T9SS type A sorting domain-containing protein [Dysgonamonadaceae bacterium]|jgi:YD repeat-containing protein|nr:T9SS type A sorting domain-containing protein [Dysgonamonadaceae bacterium]